MIYLAAPSQVITLMPAVVRRCRRTSHPLRPAMRSTCAGTAGDCVDLGNLQSPAIPPVPAVACTNPACHGPGTARGPPWKPSYSPPHRTPPDAAIATPAGDLISQELTR